MQIKFLASVKQIVITLTALFLLNNAVADKLPDFTALAKKAIPSVVSIESSGKVQSQYHSLEVPDLFEEFFGFSPFGNQMPRQMPKQLERQIRNSGSGFIISNDGEILTNAHVVSGADKVVVKLNDRREFTAKILGIDEKTDIALIKIEVKDLTPAQLGDSSKVEVGDWVLAVGSPFGFTNTATKGIVSALGRNFPDSTYTPFIQTDAAVNSGNSGGPLFNSKGEVIGINSRIYSQVGQFNGLGFAIPINFATNIANQLRQNGSFEQGFLGVGIQEVSAELAASFGMEKPQGVLVREVMKDSAAEKAGIKQGDIILNFDGKEINKMGDLTAIVATTEINKKVKTEILRKGKKITLEVVVATKDGKVSKNNKKAETKATDEINLDFWGLSLKNLDKNSKEALNYEGEGVLVSKVAPNSPAAKAGILAGDILISISNQELKTPKDAENLLGEKSNKPLAVLVFRTGNSLFFAISPNS